MTTAVNTTEESCTIDGLIRPAILKLVSESEGAYRCERDFHHHLTTCLSQVTNLELGTSHRRVYMEEPALACYGSGRKGNLDYFFPSIGSSTDSCAPLEGVAVELNYNYTARTKIKKDILKLIDPASAYSKSVYFAYGKKRKFFESVVSGIERAFNVFGEDRPEFRLPIGLHVIVVEYVRGAGHTIREARVAQTCSPTELAWTETTVHVIGEDGVAHDNRPPSMYGGITVAKLGAPERKARIYWPSSSGQKYFLAFVNQFGSCSLRKFDDSTGLFVERQREDGDFQIAFGTYLSSGKRLLLSRQPNLEIECRPTLPEWVLSELKHQIGNERRVAQTEVE